jgi:hypothetical protein
MGSGIWMDGTDRKLSGASHNFVDNTVEWNLLIFRHLKRLEFSMAKICLMVFLLLPYDYITHVLTLKNGFSQTTTKSFFSFPKKIFFSFIVCVVFWGIFELN